MVTRTSQLRRLCGLRRLEEQHGASLVEESKQTLQRIDMALEQSGEQRAAGQALIRESVARGNAEDRLAGFEEIENAKRMAKVLRKAKESAEEHLRKSRDRFLAKRTERRQAEAILDVSIQEETRSAERRGQSELDEWHRAVHRKSALTAPTEEGSIGFAKDELETYG